MGGEYGSVRLSKARGAPIRVVVRLHRRKVIEPVHRFSHVVDVTEAHRTALVAHESKQSFGERPRDLGRARQILILFLTQPRQRVTDIDPYPVNLGLVFPTAVLDRPNIEKYRALAHHGTAGQSRIHFGGFVLPALLPTTTRVAPISSVKSVAAHMVAISASKPLGKGK